MSQRRELPGAPDVGRKIRLRTGQLLSLPIVFALPVLALFDIFGETESVAEAYVDPIHLRVEYPVRTRHRLRSTMTVAVTNRGSAWLTGVEVRFSSSYMTHFDEVMFIPTAENVTGGEFVVTIGAIEPRQTNVVWVEYRTRDYGLFQGNISAVAAGHPPAVVRTQTYCYP